jgi:prevent-host-death family protein
MKSVGLFEAKNRLSELVNKAAQGEEILITRRGQQAAMLVPASRRRKRAPAEVVAHIRESRRGVQMPSGYRIRRLIEEGRR